MRAFPAVLRGLLAAGLFVASAGWTLPPERSLAQLNHTRWTLKDGAPPDVWALAQTSDGFLWLGTGAGLFRFDGLTMERFRPSIGVYRSTNIDTLLGLSGNRLLIGYHAGGVSLLEGGHLVDLSAGLPEKGRVYQFVQDRQGRVWAVHDNIDSTASGIYRLEGRHWVDVASGMGIPSGHEYVMKVAADGTVWLGGAELLFLQPGSTRFRSSGLKLDVVTQMAFDPDGRLWFTRHSETRIVDVGRLMAGAGEGAVSEPILKGDYYGPGMIFDRDGTLWWAARTHGLFRVARPVPSGPRRVELLDEKGGLTSNVARPVIEDREGNIWVGSNAGLDRFSASYITTSNDFPTAFRSYSSVRTQNGDLYLGGGDGLYRIEGASAPRLVARRSDLGTMCLKSDGGLLTGVIPYEKSGLAVWDGKKFAEIAGPHKSGRHLAACAAAADGAMWASFVGDGLSVEKDGGWRDLDLPGVPRTEAPRILAADGAEMLAYYPGRGVFRIAGDRVERRWTDRAIGIGDVQVIEVSKDAVLFGGDRGVAILAGGRIRHLTADRVPELGRITGIAQPGDGSLWFYGINGIIRTSMAAFEEALSGRSSFAFQLYNAQSGVPGTANQDNYRSTIAVGGDRRLWFFASQGVSWADASRTHGREQGPPVVIRAMTADGVRVDPSQPARLQSSVRNLVVEYTALSLTQPEATRFLYRLTGTTDSGWIDANRRRSATFANLGAGRYHLQVIAVNDAGIWNRDGATVDFEIPPTFLQSIWFKILLGLLVCFVAWVVYRLRLVRFSIRMRERAEEREREREQIARDLHDTLLQSFQGLILRFHALLDLLPERGDVRRQMEFVLTQADEAVVQGRESIHALRHWAEPDDLPALLDQAVQHALFLPNVKVSTEVKGEARPLRPGVLQELARIVGEALSNAARHANARNVTATAIYGRSGLRIAVQDDGRGIDPDVLSAGEREGHFGLISMRGRTHGLGGRFELQSGPGGGSTVSIFLPAWRTYEVGMLRRWLGIGSLEG